MATDDHSVESARAAAERNELRGWVSTFLASPGSDNAELAGLLDERIVAWAGPVKLPIDRMKRLAGPPDAPALVAVEDHEWDERVDDMEEKIADAEWEPPPVIVSYEGGQLKLEDGNHRVESLRRAGRHEAWSIVGFFSAADHERATDEGLETLASDAG